MMRKVSLAKCNQSAPQPAKNSKPSGASVKPCDCVLRHLDEGHSLYIAYLLVHSLAILLYLNRE